MKANTYSRNEKEYNQMIRKYLLKDTVAGNLTKAIYLANQNDNGYPLCASIKDISECFNCTVQTANIMVNKLVQENIIHSNRLNYIYFALTLTQESLNELLSNPLTPSEQDMINKSIPNIGFSKMKHIVLKDVDSKTLKSTTPVIPEPVKITTTASSDIDLDGLLDLL